MAGEPQQPAEGAPRSAPAGVESLTQEQIDRMLEASGASASVGAKAAVFRHTGARFPESATPPVEPYDCSTPRVMDEIVARALRIRHEEFAALLSARIAIFLRMDFTLKLQRVTSLSYRKFTASVGNPSHVTLFKAEPLTGVGVLEFNPQIGLSIVDRMLGGKGRIEATGEGLTEIETNLLDDVIGIFLEEWCRLWGDGRLRASIIGRETGGRYLQTSASDTPMLIGVFEATIGETTERIQIAIPFPSVEASIKSVVALLPAAEVERPAPDASWRPAFNHIPIPLTAEWDAPAMAVRDVIALAPGSVLALPREIIRGTHVRLSGATKFVGEIGLEDDRLAVRIDRRITPEEL